MPVYHTAAGKVEILEWGEGPELFVLLHAAAAGPHSLSALASLLLRPGRRVIAPAFNRYGATVMSDETDGVRAHLDVLRACVGTYVAERRLLFGHSMGGLVGLLGALDGLRFDVISLYEPIVPACLRTDVPSEAALLDWDRAIVAQEDIAAFVTAWNETPWDALPVNVRDRLNAAAVTLIADTRAVSYYELPVDRLERITDSGVAIARYTVAGDHTRDDLAPRHASAGGHARRHRRLRSHGSGPGPRGCRGAPHFFTPSPRMN